MDIIQNECTWTLCPVRKYIRIFFAMPICWLLWVVQITNIHSYEKKYQPGNDDDRVQELLDSFTKTDLYYLHFNKNEIRKKKRGRCLYENGATFRHFRTTFYFHFTVDFFLCMQSMGMLLPCRTIRDKFLPLKCIMQTEGYVVLCLQTVTIIHGREI